jgi:cell division septation protein DedD/TolA-binding protein
MMTGVTVRTARGAMFGAALVAGTMGATALHGQTAASRGAGADSSLYLKAQQMVNSGDAVAGRALADSLLKAAPPGTPRYAEGLYWRATLATTAADAERGYRQIVVDYPMSSRVDDALLRLGQLELARGEREAALQHFQRLTLEHPGSSLAGKASYWTARAYFEKNDVTRACTANADALSKTRAADVELRNQIEYQNQRCRGVALASTAGAPGAVPATPAETTAAKGAAAKPAAKSATKPTAKSVPVKPEATVAAAPVETPVETVAPEPEPAAEPTPAPEAAAESEPAPVAPTKSAKTAKPAPAKGAKPAAPAAASGKFAVQIAAFYDRPQADALAKKMTARGYPTHVDGDTAPFRVRVGHYATRAQAATALANMKAKRIDGYVTPL